MPNLLDAFMTEGNLQLRTLIKSAFTHVGEVSPPAEPRVGTFSNAGVVPVMTPQGYENMAAVFMEVERSLYVTPPSPRGEILRTDTGQVYWINAIDKSSPVIFVFTLTIRDLDGT